MDCCFLCGTSLSTRRRRYQCTSQLQTLLKKKCMPTPFVHAHLSLRQPVDEKEPLCVPCVNWKRRCWNGTLKRQDKPVLQMDQLIIFMVNPGRMQEPDHRCVQRLVLAIKQPGNPLRMALPIQAESILMGIEGEDIPSIVASWWKYNASTEFFASGHTARFVRSVIKSSEAEGEDD